MSAFGSCHFQLSSLLTEHHLTRCKILHRFHPLTLHLLAREAYINLFHCSHSDQMKNENSVQFLIFVGLVSFVLYKTHSVCVLLTEF